MKDPTPMLLAIILILSASSLYTSFSFSNKYEYCKEGGKEYPCAPVEGYGYLTLISMFVMILASWVLFKGRYQPVKSVKRLVKRPARKLDLKEFTWDKKR